MPDVPYSSETAPGLVIGHGNVGDGLNTDAPDLYVSSDGGYSWNRGLTGPHRSAIGDSGSVLWAVEHGEKVDTLKFSFDEGLCWRTYKFVEKPITITGQFRIVSLENRSIYRKLLISRKMQKSNFYAKN